jgi:hypothetical protein
MNTKIGLESARFLLDLEFKLEEHYEPATMSFSFGEAQVPYCVHVKKIRISLCKSLTRFYQESKNDSEKDQAMNLLLNYFYFATENSHNRYKQNLVEEIDLVLTFFTSLLSDSPTTNEKTVILDKIRMYNATKFKTVFQERIDVIKNLASSGRNLYESLELEIRNSNWFDARVNFESRLLVIMEKYPSFELFGKDLVDIKGKIGDQYSQFANALDIIGKTMPKEAKEFFREIQTNYETLIPDAIQLIKGNYEDDIYFTSIIDWLWQRRDSFILPLLWLISNGRNKDRTFYKKTDFEYYEYVIDNINPGTEKFVSLDLPEYAYLDKERTFILLDHYIKVCSDQGFDLFTMNVLDDKTKYSADFKEELLILFENNHFKIKFNDLGTSQILSFIDDNFGFEKLIDFFKKRIDHLLETEEFGRFGLNEPGYYRNPNLANEELDKRYTEILEQSLFNTEQENIRGLYLQRLFRPSIVMTESLATKIKALVEKFQTDSGKLVLIANHMMYFANSNSLWVDLMCYIAEKQLANGANASILPETFGSTFTLNLGGKSKVGVGVPYNEDVAKKGLLEAFLKTNAYNEQVNKFIKSCLDKVNKDIAATIEEDKIRFS